MKRFKAENPSCAVIGLKSSFWRAGDAKKTRPQQLNLFSPNAIYFLTSVNIDSMHKFITCWRLLLCGLFYSTCVLTLDIPHWIFKCCQNFEKMQKNWLWPSLTLPRCCDWSKSKSQFQCQITPYKGFQRFWKIFHSSS